MCLGADSDFVELGRGWFFFYGSVRFDEDDVVAKRVLLGVCDRDKGINF